MFPGERAPSHRKLFLLITVVSVIVFASLAALIYLFPAKREYVVLREIPVTTYFSKTNTITTTISRTTVASSVSLSTVTRESLIAPITSTGYDPYMISWTATYTQTIATVVSNTTVTQFVRTLTNTYVVTTSIPITYVLGIRTVVTETSSRWTSFNQTTVITTTITTAESSPSTYTRTVWTTITSLPPGLSIYAPPTKGQTEGLAPLFFCSAFATGILILRRRTVPSS